ncbi:MAG: Crp/Fnr family transcriptional regulator [Anaerolineae bacterium]
MNKAGLLRSIPLFMSLPDHEIESLGRSLGKRTFGKGMIIFHRESPGQTLYIIESGLVRIFSLSESGQEITVNLYGPGELFGEMAVLDGCPRSAGALCMERTVTYTLHRDIFLDCLERNPDLAQGVIELLTKRLRYTTYYVENLAFLDVYGRVAAKLLELGERFRDKERGGGLDLRLTQGELATWVSASRESVNKVLSQFRDQGLIAVDGQEITILDRRGLWDRVVY